MAAETINVVDLSPLGLLRIQPQIGIGHFGLIFAAAGQQTGHAHHQKNGRYSPQVTIMSVAQRFENPWGPYRKFHAG
jgi:hypothetical protein